MFEKGKVEDLVVEKLPMDVIDGQTYSIAQTNPNTLTHVFFKYPCRFIPEIPRWAIKKYIKVNDGIVFDPFAGSGTTLLEGILLGYDSYGTEIDYIAKLIIKVKTTSLSSEQIKNTYEIYNQIINKIRNEKVDVFIPDINNLKHWFNEENTIYLGKIRYLIDKIEDIVIKDFFKLCLVTIIKKVSNADDISPKPYVSTRIKKIPPNALEEFSQTFIKYYDVIIQFSKLNITKQAQLTLGNALNLKFDNKVDLAITSPPYINAFDYARTLRLENLWLGTMTESQIREKKKYYVGTEQFQITYEENNIKILNDSELLLSYYNLILPIDKKRALVVKKFFEDMKNNLSEIYNILKNDSYYVIVIGNSTIRNVEIESWKVIEQIASIIGFKTELYFNYLIKNPYIRIPRGNMGGKINKDNVLVLKKVGDKNGSKE